MISEPLQQEMSKYEGLEYVKSDLVKSKGIIYVKFRLASSALKAKEDIEQNNYMVCLPCHQRFHALNVPMTSMSP